VSEKAKESAFVDVITDALHSVEGSLLVGEKAASSRSERLGEFLNDHSCSFGQVSSEHQVSFSFHILVEFLLQEKKREREKKKKRKKEWDEKYNLYSRRLLTSTPTLD
jgi:hypothetical protein